MEDKITDPSKVLQWIRDHWGELKQKGTLEKAISKFIKIDNSDMSISDVILIEESLPEFLNLKEREEK